MEAVPLTKPDSRPGSLLLRIESAWHFRPDSDLDLAVIVEQPVKNGERVVSSRTLEGIRMCVDLLLFDPQSHEDYRPWINSVHYDIDHEGVILYERSKDQSPNRTAIEKIVRR